MSSCRCLRSELDSFRQCLLHHERVRWGTCTRRHWPWPTNPGFPGILEFACRAGCSTSSTCRYDSTVRDCYFQHCGLGGHVGEIWGWNNHNRWVSEVQTISDQYKRKHNNAGDILISSNFSMNMNSGSLENGVPPISTDGRWSLSSSVFLHPYVATFCLATLHWKHTWKLFASKVIDPRMWMMFRCQNRYPLDVSGTLPVCHWKWTVCNSYI